MATFTSNIPMIVNNISTMKDVSAQNIELSGNLFVSGSSTLSESLDVDGDVVVDGTLDVSGTTTLKYNLDVSGDVAVDGNVGIGGGHSSEKLKVYGDVNITGNIIVDGSFSFSEVVQNTTTINNTLLVSTQLDVSNEGTGPALKVSQLGDGDDQDVALFNAGDEGDALKIDSSGNTFVYKDVDISGHTNLKDVSCNGNVDICGGSLTIVGNDSDDPIVTIRKNDDGVVFDTIVIRRIEDGDNRWPGINEIQLWKNNDNVMPDLVTPSTFNTDGTPLQDIPDIPFFIDWSDKTLDPYTSTYYPSNVANETIDRSGLVVGGAYWGIQNGQNVANFNVALYIPLTSTLNTNDIQSLIIYVRVNSETMFVGARVELYNRDNDPTLTNPLAYTNTITSAVNVYRFDFPSISTYTNFVTTDSSLNITSNALISDQIAYTRPGLKIENAGLEVDGGSLNVVGDTSTDHIVKINNNSELFDTIVINKTNVSDFTNYRELQCWVNNTNIIPNNLLSVEPSNATALADNTILSDSDATFSGTQDITFRLSIFENIHNIQSIVLYNRTQAGTARNRVIGVRIELYNRANDPTLSSPLVFTNIIGTAVNVYRFDFPAISTYTGGFVSADSTTKIVSSTYALTETTLGPRTGLKIENAGLEVGGSATIDGRLTVTGGGRIYTTNTPLIFKRNEDDPQGFNSDQQLSFNLRKDNRKVLILVEAISWGRGIIRFCFRNSQGGDFDSEIATISDSKAAISPSGAFTAVSITPTSDDRLKKNEKFITNAIQTISKLRPQTYDKYSTLKCDDGFIVESGLIAQEIYYDAPELRHLVSVPDDADISGHILTSEDPSIDPDYSNWGSTPAGVNYNGFIAYLIKAIQEQQDIINEEKEKNQSQYNDLLVRIQALEESTTS